eukprot:365573-Chlamydomonas_euryale.AAC.9
MRARQEPVAQPQEHARAVRGQRASASTVHVSHTRHKMRRLCTRQIAWDALGHHLDKADSAGGV